MVELEEPQQQQESTTMTEDETPTTTTIDEVPAAKDAEEETSGSNDKKRPIEDVSKEDEDDEPKKEEENEDNMKDEKPTDNGADDKDTKSSSSSPSSSSNNQVNHEQLSCNALVLFGLPPTIKQEEMKSKMEVYGRVTRLEIRRAFASVYCFCDYETGQEAQAAIEELNGSKFQEKYTLIVKLANDKNDRSKPHTNESISSQSESKKLKSSESEE